MRDPPGGGGGCNQILVVRHKSLLKKSDHPRNFLAIMAVEKIIFGVGFSNHQIHQQQRCSRKILPSSFKIGHYYDNQPPIASKKPFISFYLVLQIPFTFYRINFIRIKLVQVDLRLHCAAQIVSTLPSRLHCAG